MGQLITGQVSGTKEHSLSGERAKSLSLLLVAEECEVREHRQAGSDSGGLRILGCLDFPLRSKGSH